MQQQYHQRDPPPYPGHSNQKQTFYQPGFRQSYSGSEASTDVSMSSNENLSLLMRQDPQGEETQFNSSVEYLELDSNSILARLGLPAVEVKSMQNGTFYVTGSCPPPGGGGNSNINVTVASELTTQAGGLVAAPKCQYIHYHHPASQSSPGQYASTTLPARGYCTRVVEQQCSPAVGQYLSATGQQRATALDDNDNNVYAKRQTEFYDLPPPPAYPGYCKQQTTTSTNQQTAPGLLHRSYEMLEKSSTLPSSSVCAIGGGATRSTPDLMQFAKNQLLTTTYAGGVVTTTTATMMNGSNEQTDDNRVICNDEQKSNCNNSLLNDETTATRTVAAARTAAERDTAAIATRATQMVELLSNENKQLREELDGYYKKVSKLQKFELEIEKMHDSYQALIKKNQKREQLEKMMRGKLDGEIKRIKETNKDFKEQLEKALTQIANKDYGAKDTDTTVEIAKKDAIIAKLIAQNKELIASRERIELENEMKNSTIQEQRSRIDILDGALTNSQATVLALENECRRKQSVERLNKSLASFQLSCDSSTTTTNNDKEQEINKTLSNKSNSGSRQSIVDATVDDLRFMVIEKDEKILELEAKEIEWEQRYYEESALRQLAIDAASMPKEARIAMLEKSSVESERKIAEARSERVQHLEEVFKANRHVAELEARVKSLQGQLVEKEAMIQVLQKHSFTGSSRSLLSNASRSSYSPTLPQSSAACRLTSSHRHNSQTDVVTNGDDEDDDEGRKDVDANSVARSSSMTSSSSSGDEKQSMTSQAKDNVSLQQMLMTSSSNGSVEKVSTRLWQV
ncbi:uncharacterized protein LOC141911434 [Tubulanus polymorphus]|uniref:uncharacterized protein LOC141911434 n=1 Tax=Tubulanus polymorphus TaxID=672921 RepID=UPI003DA4D4AD